MKLEKLLAMAALALSSTCVIAAPKPYPDSVKPIRFVVPFGPGSGTDVITRIIAKEMGQKLGATVIVLNKPGASGQIGAEYVARSAPDGYTLLVATNSTHSANPWLYKSLPYSPTKDFAPIGLMTINPLALLVKQNSPFHTPADLVRYAKEHPGKLTYGYGNTGGQVSAAMLTHMAGIEVSAISYKTTPQLFTDIIGGRVDYGFVDFAASRSLINSGKLNALATTSKNRLAFAPSMPAMDETPGLNHFLIHAWLGLMAPAGTPSAIVEQLNTVLRESLENPPVKKQLENQTSSVLDPMTTSEFKRFLTEQSDFWKLNIRTAGIPVQ